SPESQGAAPVGSTAYWGKVCCTGFFVGSSVEECGIALLLTQVTVCPTLIVTVAGSNRGWSVICTVTAAGGEPANGPAAGGAAAVAVACAPTISSDERASTVAAAARPAPPMPRSKFRR